MPQSLATTTPNTGLPAPFDAAAHGAIRSAMLGSFRPDNGGPWEIARPIPDRDRVALERRLGELQTALRQTDMGSLKRAVSMMLLGFRSERATGDEAKAIVAAYCAAMADIPSWAAAEAARRYANGEVKDASPDFAPSTARLRQTALDIAGAYRREANDIERVLSAKLIEWKPVKRPEPKPISDDQRHEIEMAKESELKRKKDAILARGPVEVSDELASMLRDQPKGEA